MKKIGLLSFLLGFIFTTSFAQYEVDVSGHTSDQQVLGPCYIFATIAALESNAIENGATTPNLNEWQFYSTCALGGSGATGNFMISNTVEHMATYGAISGDHMTPSSFNCPNPNDPGVRCIADFDCDENEDWCINDMYVYMPGESCSDNEYNNFGFIQQTGNRLNFSGSIESIEVNTLNTDEKKFEVKNLLSGGIGVIAAFKNWNNGGSHAVFIYKVTELDGDVFYYKDSYPGDAGFKSEDLDPLPWQHLTDIYYLSGSVTNPGGGGGEGSSCILQLSGPDSFSEIAYYTLSGPGAPNIINWTVTDNLTIVNGQGTSTIEVKSNTCTNETAGINVAYSPDCSYSKTVIINGESPRPYNIAVASPHWNAAGETCPNTYLELYAQVDGNYNNLYYDWNIIGATILSGQGTYSVLVQTPSYNSNLFFGVRTRRADCPFSAWRYIDGYSSSSNNGCSGGGGGGFRLVSNNTNELDFQGFFNNRPSVNEVNVGVYTINGVRLQQTKINKDHPFLNFDKSEVSGLYIIHLYDETTGVTHSFKHWVARL